MTHLTNRSANTTKIFNKIKVNNKYYSKNNKNQRTQNNQIKRKKNHHPCTSRNKNRSRNKK